MSIANTEWQIGYYLFMAIGMVISVIFTWRKDRRDAKIGDDEVAEQGQLLRNGISSKLVMLVYTHMLPLRRMYLHLSKEERLETELKITFDKPEVRNAITSYHFELFRFETLYKRSCNLSLAKRICCIIGGLCLLGLVVPGVIALSSEEVALSMGSWTLIITIVVATLAFVILTLYAFSTNRQLNYLVRHRQETS